MRTMRKLHMDTLNVSKSSFLLSDLIASVVNTRGNFWQSLVMLLLIFPILVEGVLSWSQKQEGGFEATAQFSAESVSIGDSLKIQLQLVYPDSYHVESEQLKMQLLQHSSLYAAPFAVSESFNDKKEKEGHTVKQTLEFTLIPQLPGIFPLTFYNIQFLPNSPQDIPKELLSEIVDIEISKPEAIQFPSPMPLLTLSPALPIEVDEENRKGILESSEIEEKASQYNLEVMQHSSLPWLGIFLVLAIALLIAFMKFAPIKKAIPEETAAQRMVRLQQESLNKLTALHEKKLLDQHLYSPYYMEVAATVSHYVAEKYRLQLSTKTTPELLQQIHAVIEPVNQDRVKEFFLTAERVKFAKEAPSLAECKAAEKTALDIMKSS